MQEIKILFFIVGSFFGVNESQIISEKTTVTINPTEKTIFIVHENLISIVQKESDSITLTAELLKISKADAKWDSEFIGYSNTEKEFYLSEENETLNSKLKLTYSKIEDLVAFGIDVNKNGEFSMTNFPKYHITTTDGTLNDRYWNFKADQPFTFTIEPLIDMPEHYKTLVKSLFPIWKTIKEQ
ncbi:hypothetical protein HNV10_06550 [Winogradskyella litoriviva]|uniref:Uncharacterized protein n=1 Tax=Winogradskyella litoriviva TaxID=1220182 RepID=A0ABX2E338_9FLAO|nr:hypothetical protein [Winogradskyella litoriviva]NRD22893.1 hypothetical protein [Winogradskyella litoriviva]